MSLFKFLSKKKFDIVLILLLIILTIASVMLISIYSGLGTVLKEKPRLPGYVVNSDLIFSEDGWFSEEMIPAEESTLGVLEDTFGWKSNGFLKVNEDSSDRGGIAVIHPISRDVPGYLETPEFVLPPDGYIIIGFANVNSYLMGGKKETDNIFKVYVTTYDKGVKTKTKIDQFLIMEKDGWRDIEYPISEFEAEGTRATIRVEAWAGGRDRWWGEWGGVDYIDVIPLR